MSKSIYNFPTQQGFVSYFKDTLFPQYKHWVDNGVIQRMSTIFGNAQFTDSEVLESFTQKNVTHIVDTMKIPHDWRYTLLLFMLTYDLPYCCESKEKYRFPSADKISSAIVRTMSPFMYWNESRFTAKLAETFAEKRYDTKEAFEKELKDVLPSLLKNSFGCLPPYPGKTFNEVHTGLIQSIMIK